MGIVSKCIGAAALVRLTPKALWRQSAVCEQSSPYLAQVRELSTLLITPTYNRKLPNTRLVSPTLCKVTLLISLKICSQR